MANLVRVEPALFRADEAWFIFDDGRKCLRKVQQQDDRATSSFPAPMILKDHIDPVMSHADGKMYDSKAALFRSYRPDGNPQGVRYECVGEKVAEPYKRPTRTQDDRTKAMQAVTRTLDEMGL